MIEPSLEEQRAAEAALYDTQPITLLHKQEPDLHVIGSIRDTEEGTLILSQCNDVIVLNFAQTLTLAKVLRDFFNA